MGTFVEFYTTLLGFVNFRLYTSIGLVYPPRFDSKSDEQGGELGAFTLEGKGVEASEQIDTPLTSETNGGSESNTDIQMKVDAISELQNGEDEVEQEPMTVPTEEVNDAIDSFEAAGEGADILPQPQISGIEASSLFATFSFFLSRETPRQPLEFILRAFGCKRVGWDAVLGDGAFTNNESDPTITHQVVDRPPLPEVSLPEVKYIDGEESTVLSTARPGVRIPGRTYVQPQWVWDCINEGRLLRPDLYAPGVILPPHLSPWVKPTKGAYDPTAPLAEQEREGEAEEAEGLDEDLEGEEEDIPAATAAEGEIVSNGNDLSVASSISDENDMDVAATEDSSSDSEPLPTDIDQDDRSEFGGFSQASDSDPEATLTLHQRELEAEAAGLTFSEAVTATTANGRPVRGILKTRPVNKGEEARKNAAKKRREDEEELERRKMMMPRKKRKVLDKMLYSNRKKEVEAEKLRGKRRRIEGGRG